ncbi:hypothetical protein LCGC14_1604390 [marine sediment metagenome]|uniref:Uncharacterized protein n=1 Tax=marine sediment metagenome TaxID=412755 RepID=A0A0F9KR14_9ZZZZ
MDVFLYWILPGMIGVAYLGWFWFFSVAKTPVKKITVSDMFDGLALTIFGIAMGWVTIVIAIFITYDEFDVGDIVVWKKKKKKKKEPYKVSDADILEDLFIRVKNKPSLKEELMEKLTFEQKPIKGLEE